MKFPSYCPKAMAIALLAHLFMESWLVRENRSPLRWRRCTFFGTRLKIESRRLRVSKHLHAVMRNILFFAKEPVWVQRVLCGCNSIRRQRPD